MKDFLIGVGIGGDAMNYTMIGCVAIAIGLMLVANGVMLIVRLGVK